jgi:hypothetical protein
MIMIIILKNLKIVLFRESLINIYKIYESPRIQSVIRADPRKADARPLGPGSASFIWASLANVASSYLSTAPVESRVCQDSE